MHSMHSNTSSTSTIAQSSLHLSNTGDSVGPRRKSGHAHHHHHASDLQPGIFFLASRDVSLCYGPYMVLGVMDYRTDRLQGLRKSLQNAGGQVKLTPSYHVNEVRIWHLERQIFTCQISGDLFHGGDGEMDPVCKAAEKALEHSIRRAYFNLKFRYKLDDCLLELCPCHEQLHSNDSLARLPCRKNKAKHQAGVDTKEEGQLEGTVEAGDPMVTTVQPEGTKMTAPGEDKGAVSSREKLNADGNDDDELEAAADSAQEEIQEMSPEALRESNWWKDNAEIGLPPLPSDKNGETHPVHGKI